MGDLTVMNLELSGGIESSPESIVTGVEIAAGL